MNKPSVGNATVEIEISSPILRSGLTIRTWTSEKYVDSAARSMLNIARSINTNPNASADTEIQNGT